MLEENTKLEEIEITAEDIILPVAPVKASPPPIPPYRAFKKMLPGISEARALLKQVAAYNPATDKKWYENNPDMLQPRVETRPERFPKIFDRAVELAPKAKRVLSFGCATGEETQALAKRFNKANEIVGVDIDHYSLIRARKANKDGRIFYHDELGGLGQFDIVLALMVLFCLEKPIEKERWKNILNKVAAHVKPGGIIMIYTSDYDPKEVLGDAFEDINVWTRKHNKKPEGKDYYSGYYKRRTNSGLFKKLFG